MLLQTAEHNAKALADIWCSEQECNLQLVTDEVIACKQWNKFGHALPRASTASLFSELVSENLNKDMSFFPS